MSMVPPRMPGDMERLFWEEVPFEIKGRVLKTEEEFKEFFPADEFYGDVKLVNRRYPVYVRTYKNDSYTGPGVGYNCPRCKQIIIGSPLIQDDNSIKLGIPLCGGEGYDVSCAKCYYPLDEGTLAIS